jgi:RNA polymerase sigma-70 factor (ECF subfamily)
MRRMSAIEKSAFTLRHFEGMSIEEISQALDLDASAAKQSVFRAVRKVRDALAGDRSLRPTT